MKKDLPQNEKSKEFMLQTGFKDVESLADYLVEKQVDSWKNIFAEVKELNYLNGKEFKEVLKKARKLDMDIIISRTDPTETIECINEAWAVYEQETDYCIDEYRRRNFDSSFWADCLNSATGHFIFVTEDC